MREYYAFTWPGKHDAIIEAGTPTYKILRPDINTSKNFNTTQNLYIEGDNLEALKILQRSYMRKVKMIYIDPPYNTGHDFIYSDNFTQDDNQAQHDFGLFDANNGTRNFSIKNYRENSRTNPRFHSDWCSMIYPRLKLARNLLTDDGVIFISIDDNEVTNLRKICDEIFGESNFVAQLVCKGRGGKQDSKFFAVIHEYIVCYANDITRFEAGAEVKADETYPKYDEAKHQHYKTQLLRKWGSNSRREDRPNLFYPIKAPDGSDIYPMLPEGKEGRWRWGQETMQQALDDGRVEFVRAGCWRWGKEKMKQALDDGRVEFVQQDGGAWVAYEKIYEGDNDTKRFTTWIDDIPNGTEAIKKLFTSSPFSYPKSPELIIRLLKMANLDADAIILDFFAGSSTTAHAVMAMNSQDYGHRKFIMIQLPEKCPVQSEAFKAGYENICEIGKERIRRAGEELTRDNQQILMGNYELDTGFRVLKVDSSNMKDVYFSPSELTQDMLSSLEENIKSDRSGIDLLFDAIAEIGLTFSLEYSSENFNGFTIHSYGQNEVIACFDENVNLELMKEIAKRQPVHAVFCDRCFESSPAKLNLMGIFEYYAPDTNIKIM